MDKKISHKLEDFFKQKDLVFYQRDLDNDGNDTIFILPYNIEKQNIQFDIQIFVFNDDNMCRMSFSYELDNKQDYSSQLLELNSDLSSGKISLQKDSNTVTYAIYFNVQENQSIEEIYETNLEKCLIMLARLYSENIIKK